MDSEASSSGGARGNGPQGSESEGEGEDIEEAEFEEEDDSLYEETSQDRAMIDDFPQIGRNPLVEYGQYNALIQSDSEAEDLFQFVKRRFKRPPAANPLSPLQTRRRARVLRAASSDRSSDSLSDESRASWDQCARSDEDIASSEGEADHRMPEAPSHYAGNPSWWRTKDRPSEPESDTWSVDHGWSRDIDFDVEDEFATKCMIVPRPPMADSQVTTHSHQTSLTVQESLLIDVRVKTIKEISRPCVHESIEAKSW
jgi:hypothetical protein